MNKYPNETVLLKTEDGELVSIFKPSLFRLIPNNSGNLETESGVKFRFFFRRFVGYRIWILRKKSTFIAYVMCQRGPNPRYRFVKRNMTLMGPYFVDESFRGRGYAKQLLDIALDGGKNCTAVYAWIVSANESSRRALEKSGFHRAGWMCGNGLKKNLVQQQTNYEIWKKDLDK